MSVWNYTFVMILMGVSAFAGVTLDGDLSEWSSGDRLYPAPWQQASDYAVYGSYDAATATYYIALETNSNGVTSIGAGTTVWLNTDRITTTGHLIWGWAGGAEYNVNVYSDGKPYLYTGAAAQNFVTGPLAHGVSSNGRIMEFALPAAQIGGVSGDIDFLLDLNNSVFLPASYSDTQYRIRTRVLPPRTDFAKRAAVVFSKETRDNFYDDKAYSQLYAAAQHQVMMAGIPYERIYVDDLKTLSNLVNYDVLVFPYNANIKAADRETVRANLMDAVYHYGIGIVTADNWLTNDETGAALSGNSYQDMHHLLGVGRVTGTGPVDVTVKVANTAHPVMKGYAANEQLFDYSGTWYSTYGAVSGTNATVTVLATQDVDNGGTVTTENAILASETGARHVHFASVQLLGDGNLLWQALQWVLYGNETPVGLKMGRQKSIFLARNDMDQSMYAADLHLTEIPLYDDFLVPWKDDYNFVGTYFINIGDNQSAGEYTDWTVSGPLYQDYIDLGNEIGSHSYTHPHNINSLTNTQLEYEFNQAQQVIASNLSLSAVGTAQPGNPENMAVATYLDQYLPYFSGGYSGVGAGYPGAFGWLSPDFDSVYFAPNMYFDFTMVQFLGWTAAQSEAYWAQQYADILSHASQPLVHWPWHDYGPTISLPNGYSIAMFENTIALAYNDDTEFTTTWDMHNRIKSFVASDVSVSESNGVITATVTAADVGKFSLEVHTDDVIEKVDNWYAYDSDTVFMPTNGGTFTIHQAASADGDITRISKLPMRAELQSLTGDGNELSFTFEGEGTVQIHLNAAQAANLTATGADTVVVNGTTVTMTWNTNGIHTGVIEN